MRELDSERVRLENSETKTIADIKKMAKMGQMVRFKHAGKVKRLIGSLCLYFDCLEYKILAALTNFQALLRLKGNALRTEKKLLSGNAMEGNKRLHYFSICIVCKLFTISITWH